MIEPKGQELRNTHLKTLSHLPLQISINSSLPRQFSSLCFGTPNQSSKTSPITKKNLPSSPDLPTTPLLLLPPPLLYTTGTKLKLSTLVSLHPHGTSAAKLTLTPTSVSPPVVPGNASVSAPQFPYGRLATVSHVEPTQYVASQLKKPSQSTQLTQKVRL